jgi:MFS family permease
LIEPDVPAFLIDKAGASSTVVGLLFTLSGVSYGLAAIPVERLTEWFGRRFAISLGLVIMAVGMPILVLYPSIILVGMALCLVTVAYACAMNPLLTELADAVDRCAAGAYASVYAIFNIAYAIGTLLGGLVASHFSLLTASLSIGVILLLSVPLLRWGLISVSALPTEQTRADKA